MLIEQQKTAIIPLTTTKGSRINADKFLILNFKIK
jgi:hypothetical protein